MDKAQSAFDAKHDSLEKSAMNANLQYQKTLSEMEHKLEIAHTEKSGLVQSCMEWNEKCDEESQKLADYVQVAQETQLAVQQQNAVEVEQRVQSLKVGCIAV
jgi:hypothetical protein